MNIKKNKVMVIHTIAWSHYAGIVFSRLNKLLCDDGMELYVIHLAKTQANRRFLGNVDLSVHRYPYKILFNGSLENYNVLRKIFDIIKEVLVFSPYILIVGGYNDMAMIFAFIINKIFGGINVLASDTTYFDKKRVFYKEIVKRGILKLVDYGFCVGSAQKDYLIALGMDQNNVFIASYYSIDNLLFREKSSLVRKNKENVLKEKKWKLKNFIFVGRFIEGKNILTLIESFYELKRIEKKADEWGLIIVGDGPLKNDIVKLINDLNLNESVYLVGGKKWDEVPEYYGLADVFVLSSTSEAWGLVINEAMACGLPVIISKRAGAYRDLVKEGVNGFGFDPYDKGELVNIMLKFVKEEVNIKEMGSKSMEIIENYSPDKQAIKLYNTIKKLYK